VSFLRHSVVGLFDFVHTSQVWEDWVFAPVKDWLGSRDVNKASKPRPETCKTNATGPRPTPRMRM